MSHGTCSIPRPPRRGTHATLDRRLGAHRDRAVDAALALVEHDPAALVALAGAFSRAGDRDGARADLGRALDLARRTDSAQLAGLDP